jgi:hypothetical protein
MKTPPIETKTVSILNQISNKKIILGNKNEYNNINFDNINNNVNTKNNNNDNKNNSIANSKTNSKFYSNPKYKSNNIKDIINEYNNNNIDNSEEVINYKNEIVNNYNKKYYKEEEVNKDVKNKNTFSHTIINNNLIKNEDKESIFLNVNLNQRKVSFENENRNENKNNINNNKNSDYDDNGNDLIVKKVFKKIRKIKKKVYENTINNNNCNNDITSKDINIELKNNNLLEIPKNRVMKKIEKINILTGQNKYDKENKNIEYLIRTFRKNIILQGIIDSLRIVTINNISVCKLQNFWRKNSFGRKDSKIRRFLRKRILNIELIRNGYLYYAFDKWLR